MDSVLGRLQARIEETQVFASARSRQRFLIQLLAVLVVLAVVTVLAQRYFAFLTDPEELRSFVRAYGFWSPLVLVLLQALQVVVAPVPGQILAVAAGYLFGAWWGTVYNMVGVTIGSTVAFWLSRRFGREYVENIVHEDALERFDAVGEDYVRLALFFFFLVPGLPDDVLCFAGGLTELPLWQLVAIAVVGRTPGFLLANFVGEFLVADRFTAAVVLTALLVAVSVVGYLNRDRLVRLFGDER